MTNPWTVFTRLAVDPENPAAQWCRSNPSDPRAPAILSRIANVPQMKWLGPGSGQQWVTDYVQTAVAAKALPQLVLYAIPNRDLGSYSAGGAATAAAYRAFVDTVAKAIGTAPCIVLVEPDSLSQLVGAPQSLQLQRFELLQYAVATIARNCPNAWVYLDAGDGYYSNPSVLAPLLIKAGVGLANGFAVNVANVNPTTTCTAYGATVNAALNAAGIPSKALLIDTSRNGAGRPSFEYIQAHPADWWCNTPGSRLGAAPSLSGSVWAKAPGVSDGPVGAVPGVPSGQFDPRLAMALINGVTS